jgi:voltage-gated potassium channel
MVSGILVFALWAGILASGYAEELRRREFLRTWDLVAKVPFFHDVGAAVIADVARLLRPRDFPGGAVIMRRGERGAACILSPRGNLNFAAGGRRYPTARGTFLASWRC